MVDFPEGDEPLGSDADFLEVSGLTRDEWWSIEAAARYAQDNRPAQAEAERYKAGYGGFE